MNYTKFLKQKHYFFAREAFVLSFESTKNELINDWLTAMLIFLYELIAILLIIFLWFNGILRIYNLI